MVLEREGLIARIRQVRRAAESANDSPRPSTVNRRRDRLDALEARVAYLEDLVQGLQDSVHREASRHGTRIAELEARMQPAAVRKALNDDARKRGL